jgi:hypothetical protein
VTLTLAPSSSARVLRPRTVSEGGSSDEVVPIARIVIKEENPSKSTCSTCHRAPSLLPEQAASICTCSGRNMMRGDIVDSDASQDAIRHPAGQLSRQQRFA